MRPRSRWRFAASLAAVTTAAAGLTLSGPGQQALAATISQAGPFPVGNLLNYTNSDIESAGFNWAADLSQASHIKSIGQDATTQVMHGHSLEIVASGSGTIVYTLGNTQDSTSVAIDLPKTGGDYRVGAYLQVPADTSQHTVEFDLQCYDSSGTLLGWVTGTPVTMNTAGTWQYVEDDFVAGKSTPLPSTCAQVQASPRVKVTGMTAEEIVHMDDAILAPYRAAIAIGAHGQDPCMGCAYTPQDWFASDQAIGPSQTDKEFHTDLPASFSDTNCAGDEAQLASNGQGPPAWPVCIIAYVNPVISQTAMDNFLRPQSDTFPQGIPAQQEIILVWHQEPEGDKFTDQPGCPMNLTSYHAFVCETKLQGAFVHDSQYDTPNVLIGQDSAGSKYASDPDAQMCRWITPASATGPGVDLYLVDHYENGTVNPVNVNNAVNALEWQDWLKCASAEDRPLGFGEYGLDNSPIGPTALCDNSPPGGPDNAVNLPKALDADKRYLQQLPMSPDVNLVDPAPFVIWDYWYSNYGGTPVCTVFDDTYGAIGKWHSIETENGGT